MSGREAGSFQRSTRIAALLAGWLSMSALVAVAAVWGWRFGVRHGVRIVDGDNLINPLILLVDGIGGSVLAVAILASVAALIGCAVYAPPATGRSWRPTHVRTGTWDRRRRRRGSAMALATVVSGRGQPHQGAIRPGRHRGRATLSVCMA